jgi:hypothetical protein
MAATGATFLTMNMLVGVLRPIRRGFIRLKSKLLITSDVDQRRIHSEVLLNFPP